MSEWLKECGCKPHGYAYAGSNPAPPIALRRPVVRRVGERRLVAAAAAECVVDRSGLRAQLFHVHFAPRDMVAGDDARHGLLVGHGSGDADLDLSAGPKPAAAGRVVDLDPGRTNPDQPTRLERPRELPQRRPVGMPQKDLSQRLTLRSSADSSKYR
jgi:hypothetical protein